MPKKKHAISDAERAKRLKETASALETSNDPKDFERAFKSIVARPPKKKSAS